MLHCACSVETGLTARAGTPSRLVLELDGYTGPAGYRLRGRIEIEGVDAWRLDALDSALARRLNGHATLMLGPADLDNLLSGDNVESVARRIAHDYDLTPDEFARKAGLLPATAADLLTHDRHSRRTSAAASALTRQEALAILARIARGELAEYLDDEGIQPGVVGIRDPIRAIERIAQMCGWDKAQTLIAQGVTIELNIGEPEG